MAKTSFYSKQSLLSLFLMCAFPLLFWALLLSFRDVSWLTERTNLWDAIGVVAYGLIFACVESIALFLIMVVLGLLISRKWSIEHRAALMGMLALIISLWSIIEQAYFLLGMTIPTPLILFLLYTRRPVLTMNLAALVLIILSVSFPTYFILHSAKALKSVRDFMERISTLSMFYLFLAFAGLVIIIIRNI